VLDILLRAPGADDRTEAGKSLRNELLVQVSRYCHPSCLIRRGGRYFDNLFCSEGFRRDGWCEQKAKLTFSPSDKGDFLIIQIGRVAKSQPTRLSVRINRQKPMSFVLLNEHAALEIPILELSVPTEVTLESDRAFKLNLRDEKEYSFQIDGADLVSKQTPMPTFFRGNKSDAREKLASGIYTNGAASNLARIRIDNPFPGDVEIMAHIVARQPQSLRKGQFFRIQINHDEPHESFISGKHLMVSIPCPGRPRYISILLQFWDRNGSETEPTENRAIIKSIDILPTTVKSVDIKCGYRGALGYLLNNLKSKISKRFS
jgi:hypothetical protein